MHMVNLTGPTNEEAIPKPLKARGIPLDDRHRAKKEQ
jgi:hypothetical protein